MKKMEAKLIKENNNYYLKHNDKIIGTIDAHPLSSINVMKLSLKNCQEIERGYDLDELAKEFVDYEDSLYHSTIKNTYMHGFQKALEIIGNKKFSSRNILKSFTTGVFTDENSDYDFEFTELMQDLQQTEWDVEIVTTKRMENGKSGLDVPIIKPKLDADGCLILKRK